MHDGLRRFVQQRGVAQRMVEPSAAFRKDAFSQVCFLPSGQQEIYSDVVGPPFQRRSLDQSDQSGFRGRIGCLAGGAMKSRMRADDYDGPASMCDQHRCHGPEAVKRSRQVRRHHVVPDSFPMTHEQSARPDSRVADQC